MSNCESALSIDHFGLKTLEEIVDQDTFIYIVRTLYSVIFQAKKMNYTKEQLQRRIQRFEKESHLPGFLSAMPIDRLLIELEDVQYVYPIRRREISFPTFY